jgi:hypothetical protein
LIRSRHWALAGLVLVIDGLVLGQAGLSVLMLTVWLLVCPLLAIFWLVRREQARSARWALVPLPYALALALVALTLWGNNQLALSRTTTVVAALDAYHAARGVYPRHLSELCSEFLPSVPRAKFTLTGHAFIYVPTDESALLGFNSMPPFGRRLYDLRTRAWTSID